MESKTCCKVWEIRLDSQMKSNKPVFVYFADKKLEETFKQSVKDDPVLYKSLNQAIDNLKDNPFCGIHISKKLIPKIYIKKYNINNLWKYNLPGAWRLIYSIVGSEINIITILLEWLPHKKYNRRFKY